MQAGNVYGRRGGCGEMISTGNGRKTERTQHITRGLFVGRRLSLRKRNVPEMGV